MKEERKPTLEEMIEAYRRQSRVIDEACRLAGPPKIDFERMPPNRRKMLEVRVCTVLAAIAVGAVLNLSLMPMGECKMNWGADDKGSIETMDYMLRNRGI